MNAIILHVPKGFWSEDWRHNFINVVPMGVFAIANYCNSRGHSVRVANSAVFRNRQAAIEAVLGRIRETNARVIGLPLHWHLCGYDVLQTAEFLKQEIPNIHVVVGGLTASVFAAEIMDCCKSVDAVVAGDGEVPFCMYLDAVESGCAGSAIAHIPNLFWRQSETIRENRSSYAAGDEELSKLSFSPQPSIFSIAEYTNGMRMADTVEGIQQDMLEQPVGRKLFFMNIGRGCSLDCVYCGGSRRSFRRYCRRERINVRSPESVAADFERCHEAGFERFHIGFDPPFPHKEEYFQDLFALLRRRFERKLQLVFEVYGLPSRAFIDAAARTFAWTGLILSPCFFDWQLRARLKGYSFTDREMEAKLAEIAGVGNCSAFVYYGVTRLEEWTEPAIDRRIAYMRDLQVRYGCEISVLPIYTEPGSSWVAFPDVFSVPGVALTFRDFLSEWSKPANEWNDVLTGIRGTGQVMQRMAASLRLDNASV